MLGRNNRFHGLNSLSNTYRNGSTVRGGLINVKVATRNPQKPYRIAVVVSKKVSKSAVQRNRIRRRVYEAVRRNQNLITPGEDLIFTVFNEQVADLSAPKLDQLIVQLLKRASNSDSHNTVNRGEHVIVNAEGDS
jgi:ribonuclease P protein component